MFTILFKYLLINRQVSIPGIGDFRLVQQNAKIDYAAQVVHAPCTAIQFANKSATADKNFFRFASAELGVEDWDTIRKFHDFSFKLKNKLDTEMEVDLPGMGVLTKDQTGKIAFKAKKFATEFFPSISFETEPLIHEPKPQSQLKTGDMDALYDGSSKPSERTLIANYWWVAALVLALISVAAIAYYYFILQKGFSA